MEGGMTQGKSISVRFSHQDVKEIELTAALAGYTNLSAFIRDKTLGRGRFEVPGQSDVSTWSSAQEVAARLAELDGNLKASHVMLTMLLTLARKRATTGEVAELVGACQVASNFTDVMYLVAPDLMEQVERLQLR